MTFSTDTPSHDPSIMAGKIYECLGRISSAELKGQAIDLIEYAMRNAEHLHEVGERDLRHILNAVEGCQYR